MVGIHYTSGSGLLPFTVEVFRQGSWSVLPSNGLAGFVYSVAELPTGEIVLSGWILLAGLSVNVVAWNGSSWSAVGGGVDDSVSAMVVAPNGDLIVGGKFLHANGVLVNRLARWDGTAWHAFGAGVNNPLGVEAIAFGPQGDMFIGGHFTVVDGVPAARIARWNGATWSPMGAGANASVLSLAFRSNGDLLVGGWLTTAGGVAANGFIKWDGAAFRSLGSYQAHVEQIVPLADGRAFLVGAFDNIWNGVNIGLGSIVWNGDNSDPAFSLLGQGVDDVVRTIAFAADGSLLVGGDFRTAGPGPAYRLARWTGSSWQAFADRIGDNTSGSVHSVVETLSGDILVGGTFLVIGGVPMENLARWDGANFYPETPGGVSTRNPALLRCEDGRVYVGVSTVGQQGLAGVYAHTSAGWVPLGVFPDPNFLFLSLQEDGDGILAVGAGGIYRWDGQTWSPGSAPLPGSGDLRCAARLDNGDLVAGFWAAGLKRFNGANWTPLLAGWSIQLVDAMVKVPGGDLLLSCRLTNDSSALRRILRWNGVQASQIELLGGSALTTGMAMSPAGDAYVFGRFVATSRPAVNIMRLSTTCPATIASYGPNCVPGLALGAMRPAWLGESIASTASGLPANGLAVNLYGFATAAVPLSSLLSLGTPGCDLLCSGEVAQLTTISSGTASLEIGLPHDPGLAGFVVYNQVLTLSADPAGAWVGFAATNGLAFTLGAF